MIKAARTNERKILTAHTELAALDPGNPLLAYVGVEGGGLIYAIHGLSGRLMPHVQCGTSPLLEYRSLLEKEIARLRAPAAAAVGLTQACAMLKL